MSSLTMKDIVRYQLTQKWPYRFASIASCIAVSFAVFLGLRDLTAGLGAAGIVLSTVLAILMAVTLSLIWDRLQGLQPILDSPVGRWKLIGVAAAVLILQILSSSYPAAEAIGGSDAVQASMEEQTGQWTTIVATASDNAQKVLGLQADIQAQAANFMAIAEAEISGGRLTRQAGAGTVSDSVKDVAQQLQALADNFSRRREEVASLRDRANLYLYQAQDVIASQQLSTLEKQKKFADIANNLKQVVDHLNGIEVLDTVLRFHIGTMPDGGGISSAQSRALVKLAEQARQAEARLREGARAVRDQLVSTQLIIFHPRTKGQAILDYALDREILAWCIPLGLDSTPFIIMLIMSAGWRDARTPYHEWHDPRDGTPRTAPYSGESFRHLAPESNAESTVTPFRQAGSRSPTGLPPLSDPG